MTNKEKAEEIAEKYYKMFDDCTLATGIEKGAIEMAKWKDEQIISLLPRIITVVYQSITQCASDEVTIEEIKNLIKQVRNYAEPKPFTVEGRIKNVRIDCGPKTNEVFASMHIPDISFEEYDKLKKLKSNVKIIFEEI